MDRRISRYKNVLCFRHKRAWRLKLGEPLVATGHKIKKYTYRGTRQVLAGFCARMPREVYQETKSLAVDNSAWGSTRK